MSRAMSTKGMSIRCLGNANLIFYRISIHPPLAISNGTGNVSNIAIHRQSINNLCLIYARGGIRIKYRLWADLPGGHQPSRAVKRMNEQEASKRRRRWVYEGVIGYVKTYKWLVQFTT